MLLKDSMQTKHADIVSTGRAIKCSLGGSAVERGAPRRRVPTARMARVRETVTMHCSQDTKREMSVDEVPPTRYLFAKTWAF